MRILPLSCLVLAACQMYGGPSEHLHKVIPRNPPPGTEPVAVAPVYRDECRVDFHAEARAVHRQPQAAEALVVDANTTIANASKAPVDAAKADLVVKSIDKYVAAPRADPYSAAATLRLAVAYDQVRYKGCALAMLRRLHALGANTKLVPDQAQRIDDLVDNPQWFKDYRKEALAAANP